MVSSLKWSDKYSDKKDCCSKNWSNSYIITNKNFVFNNYFHFLDGINMIRRFFSIPYSDQPPPAPLSGPANKKNAFFAASLVN